MFNEQIKLITHFQPKNDLMNENTEYTSILLCYGTFPRFLNNVHFFLYRNSKFQYTTVLVAEQRNGD